MEPLGFNVKELLYIATVNGGNLISAPTTDLQGRYEFISIKWP
jgi:hypothetical protein